MLSSGAWHCCFSCMRNSRQPSAVSRQQENYGLTNILFAESRQPIATLADSHSTTRSYSSSPTMRRYASRYFSLVLEITSSGKFRGRRFLVPTDLGEVVPDELFIETLLRLTGFIEIRGPETGGIWREDFINDNQFSVALSEFKFGITKDNPGTFGVLTRSFKECETGLNQSVRKFAADFVTHLINGDWFVMFALFCLGCRCEQKFWKSIRFTQSIWQFLPTNFACFLIRGPNRNRQDIHGQHIQHRPDLLFSQA